MESRIWRLGKLKLVSNGNITNKIPFLDVYGDINLVGHVIKSYKARRVSYLLNKSKSTVEIKSKHVWYIQNECHDAISAFLQIM